MPTGGYNNIEAQYVACTKSGKGMNLFHQDTLPAKGQQI